MKNFLRHVSNLHQAIADLGGRRALSPLVRAAFDVLDETLQRHAHVSPGVVFGDAQQPSTHGGPFSDASAQPPTEKESVTVLEKMP